MKKNNDHHKVAKYKKLILASSIASAFCCASFAFAQPLPYSDPNNIGGWVLNEAVSDEFEGNSLAPDKWFIEGQNGDYYIWKGRAPSQFVPHNVIVEDGKLKLRTQWEPDFEFIQESYEDGPMGKSAYGKLNDGTPMPVTTAAVITNKRFLHGYMEIKSKVGKAAITGAFWSIGYEQELDIFEQMGNPKNKKGNLKPKVSLSTIHDWSPPAERPTQSFQHSQPLDFDVSEEFAIYGAEWGKDYLKLYINGKLIRHVTQDEIGTDWVLNNPMEIWLDSEIFHWLGYPDKDELPVDFEIEYLRVWQKPIDNLLAPAFFGFEGPMLYEDQPRPLTLTPEMSVNNDYQKFWQIEGKSAEYFSIIEGDYVTGVNSLEFRPISKTEELDFEQLSITSPEGAVRLPKGDFKLKAKVWLDQGRVPDAFEIKLNDENVQLRFDNLNNLARKQWVTVEQVFSKMKASSSLDSMTIQVDKADLPFAQAFKKRNKARFLIDDIEVVELE
jgi:beta-glucanase (GH16 family)